MRILYVLPAISHPAMRGELRHHHFMTRLAARHAVTLVALTRTHPGSDVVADLRRRIERLELIEALPPQTSPGGASGDRSTDGVLAWRRRLAKKRRWRDAIAEMQRVVRRLIADNRFDVALAYGSELGQAVTTLDGPPLVADICDAESARLKQALRYVSPVELPWRLWRWRQTARAERSLLERAAHAVFISERDRVAVEGANGHSSVIPSGVDIDYWRPAPVQRAPHCLVFTGTMDYPSNADAATFLMRQILPRVRAAFPDVELIIAGRGPSQSLQRLALQSGAVVTGAVADLRPYLQRASVFVAPLRFASGMQNKILEAMAMELPVVTTPVAAAGLQLGGARAPVIVADSATDFVETIRVLLRDARSRDKAGRNGRAFVQQHFSWAPSANQLEDVCLEAARERRRTA